MDLDLLLEAERRGILPEDKQGLLAEARKRGLVGAAPQTEKRGVLGTLKDNLLGDDDDTTQNLGEKVGSFLNKAGESMTFGLVGDEADAAVRAAVGGDYQTALARNRQQEELFTRENPGAALAAEIGGALVAPVGALGAVGKGASMGRRMLASGAATAAASGLYGGMEAEGGLPNRAEAAKNSALIGGGVGAAIPIAGAGVQKVADSLARRGAIRAATRNAPTTAQLRAQGQAAYKAVDDAGVRVNPQAVDRMKSEIAGYLRGEGAGFTGAEKVLPASRAIMQATDDVGKGANSVPFEELDMFRRYMGNAAGANPANRGDTRAASEAIGKMDDFIGGLTKGDVDAGDIQALQTMLPKARETWSRMSRSQTIDDAIEAAGNYQSGKASGLANQFRRILNNDKTRRAFSDAEIKVMRRVVDGTMPEKVLRYMGSGLGMMGQMAVGGTAGAGMGPLGMALGAGVGGATAALTRKGSEAVASRNAEIARALVANGGLKTLPVATDGARQIVEQLLRRGTAATAH